jgi:beta-carotene ketolase (CrtW type)
VWVALTIVVAWAGLFAFLLTCRVDEWADIVWIVPANLALAWLYTGLFITAHDGMHGVISRRHRWINDALGRFCTQAYAGLSYSSLKTAHHRHHAHAGTVKDPDFASPGDVPVWRWFLQFMVEYFTVGQLARLVGVFLLLRYVAEVPFLTLWVFWLIPSLASTLQLFVVGTWLPHRAGPDLQDPHRARTVDLPEFWSLLACFHFGYHLEHHSAPSVPWWGLPAVRRASTRGMT